MTPSAGAPAKLIHASSPATGSSPGVAILLCTFNGEDFLQKQLESIVAQTHNNWVIHVSDDGSNDSTTSILNSYQESLGHHRFKIYEGPKLGFAKNFLSLIKNESINGDYFAFSDQDDVWHSTKLERGISSLKTLECSLPALYCSRVRLINAEGQLVGMSPLRSKTPSFKNALVQSIAGGNTMLINPPARDLLAMTPNDVSVAAHDWLTYLLVTASGGFVIYDKTPSLDYRQHENNLIGNKTGILGILGILPRLKSITTERFSLWTDQNCYLLNKLDNQLTKDNHNTLKSYEELRHSGLITRIKLLYRIGLYRQGTLDNFLFILALILKKI
jgi:glycosyltransferase involved in cell wall biosynthesis